MAKGSSFWGFLVVAIIVAVIASLITLSVTGNAVKISKSSGEEETYTKTEVDSMIDSLKEELAAGEKAEDTFSCDITDICEINQLSAEGSIKASSLSNPDSPLKKDNAYVCVSKEGVLYRGTSIGCK